MNKSDIPELFQKLSALHRVIRGSALDAEGFAFYVETLRAYRIEDVKRAIDLHVSRSRFFPAPSEIADLCPRPHVSTQQPFDTERTNREREKRQAAADQFLTLPQETQEKLKEAFLEQANNFERRRMRGSNPVHLSRCLSFLVFLADSDDSTDDRKRAGS